MPESHVLDLSLMIPIGGDAPFLQQCLASLDGEIDRTAASGLTSEVLLILDRPTMATENICDSWAFYHPNTRIVQSRKPGLAQTLNVGIEHARGRFIARLDSDDEILPNRLTAQVSALRNNSGLSLVGGQIVRVFGDRQLSTSRFPTVHDQILSYLLRGHHAVSHSAVMLRREDLVRLGGYWAEGVAEDWDLYLRLSEVGRLANLETSVIRYRFHDQSINSRTATGVREGVALAILNHKERRRSMPISRRPDLTWRKHPIVRLRINRESRMQWLYRRWLRQPRYGLAWGGLGLLAGLFAPTLATRRLVDLFSR